MSLEPKILLVQVPRVLIGLLLIATGIAKILDIPGFAKVLSHYQIFHGMLVYNLVAYTLPFIEIVIGISLLFAWQTKWGALAAIFLHLAFIVILTITIFRGIHLDNCGCFGVYFARPLSWKTILEDFVMLAFSVVAWVVA
mgnify:CR=1 FL=1